MPVARSLYVNQTVAIDPSNAGAGALGLSGIRYLPVQSASCEVTRPIEDILSFGKLGSLARTQVNVSTCKADIKTYIANATGGTGASNYANLLNAYLIQTLTGNALAGTNSKITVSPNGFVMSGILASIGVDIALGQFATADLSFAGVGEPTFAAAPTSASFGESSDMPSTFSPITSTNVGGELVSGCPNSFKFSLDIPNEVVSCLGGVLSGTQAEVVDDFLQVAKPPFKATVSVEGNAVDLPNNPATAYYDVGKLRISLPAAQISSRSFNQAVGQIGATYSWTLESTSANFQDIA